MKRNAQYWIDLLKLERHAEGGYFREIYRSDVSISTESLPAGFSGPRSVATSIYFLLEGEDFSAFHQLKSDEIWNFYQGDSLTVYNINPSGVLSYIFLGDNPENGEVLQAVVPAGHWFASRVNNPEGFSLVGCTVAPGFDFDDFTLGSRKKMSKQFPQHAQLISELTRLP